MSAASTLSLPDLFGPEELEDCRFCGCTEDAPCPILISWDASGVARLACNEAESNDVIFCAWYIHGVCNSPLCIEKLLEEKRGKVLLFDASGRKVG
jgi:hypothetical protein